MLYRPIFTEIEAVRADFYARRLPDYQRSLADDDVELQESLALRNADAHIDTVKRVLKWQERRRRDLIDGFARELADATERMVAAGLEAYL